MPTGTRRPRRSRLSFATISMARKDGPKSRTGCRDRWRFRHPPTPRAAASARSRKRKRSRRHEASTSRPRPHPQAWRCFPRLPKPRSMSSGKPPDCMGMATRSPSPLFLKHGEDSRCPNVQASRWSSNIRTLRGGARSGHSMAATARWIGRRRRRRRSNGPAGSSNIASSGDPFRSIRSWGLNKIGPRVSAVPASSRGIFFGGRTSSMRDIVMRHHLREAGRVGVAWRHAWPSSHCPPPHGSERSRLRLETPRSRKR